MGAAATLGASRVIAKSLGVVLDVPAVAEEDELNARSAQQPLCRPVLFGDRQRAREGSQCRSRGRRRRTPPLAPSSRGGVRPKAPAPPPTRSARRARASRPRQQHGRAAATRWRRRGAPKVMRSSQPASERARVNKYPVGTRREPPRLHQRAGAVAADDLPAQIHAPDMDFLARVRTSASSMVTSGPLISTTLPMDDLAGARRQPGGEGNFRDNSADLSMHPSKVLSNGYSRRRWRTHSTANEFRQSGDRARRLASAPSLAYRGQSFCQRPPVARVHGRDEFVRARSPQRPRANSRPSGASTSLPVGHQSQQARTQLPERRIGQLPAQAVKSGAQLEFGRLHALLIGSLALPPWRRAFRALLAGEAAVRFLGGSGRALGGH